MIQKKPRKNGKTALVTFTLPKEMEAGEIHLCGEFNGWDEQALPLARRRDGRFSTSLSLPRGRYRFRYLLDGTRWENDESADAYVPNPFGTEDSVIEI